MYGVFLHALGRTFVSVLVPSPKPKPNNLETLKTLKNLKPKNLFLNLGFCSPGLSHSRRNTDVVHLRIIRI